MRRTHSEVIDPVAIEDILRTATIGRMATVGRDGYPYVTPVNFVYHGGDIYFHCAPEGEKLDNIARDPRVCFEVDVPLSYLDSAFDPERRACKLHQFFHCVIIRGQASIVPDGPLKTDVLNALSRKREPSDLMPVTEGMPAYKACSVVRIKPEATTAKSDLGQNKTPEERLALARYLAGRNQPGDAATVTAMGYDPIVLRQRHS
ncbi:MAG: pyridoxamine 5'-phosphate oxidase family protein [Dehalococcoidia bacterium]|jgi:nitroimidazol reductase NimA-like FMN-containing flavoprotein (pyridoxamine 5'-phosphate oxidase superfamily)|nr:pyridoxamine 5'-phosphate oxidase family protein [Dehalococcoidia bacterium]